MEDIQLLIALHKHYLENNDIIRVNYLSKLINGYYEDCKKVIDDHNKIMSDDLKRRFG
jgi:hypothetical protein